MLRNEKLKRTEKRFTPQKPRFPGIVSAASKLGVSRIHLWYVLRGVREDTRDFVRRYRKLAREAVK